MILRNIRRPVPFGPLVLPIVALLVCTGCHSSPPREASSGNAKESRDIISWAAFGSSNVTEMAVACAGRVELKQGAASVKDSCFSGETNVVVCTDATAPNPVMCAPGKDALSIVGSGTDTVSYARVR